MSDYDNPYRLPSSVVDDAYLAAQDPAELFDVVLADGTPTGRTKRRDAVHRDGDWHRSIHVWIFGLDAVGREVLTFQRRGRHKDTHPLMLDATVGGHYRSGERLTEALRETAEEIGRVVEERELIVAGVRQGVTEDDILRDREIQDVYLVRDDRPLAAFRPNPDELDALVRVEMEQVIALHGQGVAMVEGRKLDAATLTTTSCPVRISDLVPTIDRYFLKVALAARAHLRGEPVIAV